MLNRLLSAVGLERRSTSPNDTWGNFTALRNSGAVNATTAQSVSAVYACVQAISETTASLPLILFKRNDEDRNTAPDHPLYRVLAPRPLPE